MPKPLKIDIKVLKERLVTKESCTIVPPRSTLSRAAYNYRDFLIALHQAQSQTEKEKTEVIGIAKDDDKAVKKDSNMDSNMDSNKDSNKDMNNDGTKNDKSEKGDDTANNDKDNETEKKDEQSDSSSPISRLEHAKIEVINALKLHDLEMRKVALGCKATVSELQYYEVIAKETNESILQIKREIETLREKLNHEKKVRKNREEYEGLAKQASKRSPALVTKRKLKQVHSDIKELEMKRRKTNERIEMRRKQFQGLMQSIFDLKNSLDEDDARKEIERNVKEREDKESNDDKELYNDL